MPQAQLPLGSSASRIQFGPAGQACQRGMSERVLSSEQSKQRSLAHAAVQQACAVRSCSGWVLRALLRAVALGDCNPPVPTAFRCARDWVCRVQGSCRTGHGMCMCVGPKHVQDCGAELLHACWGGMATPEASMGHVTHGSPPPRCAPGGPYRTTAPSTHGITTCGPKPTHLGCNCPQWPLQHARAGCCMQGAWN